ncbi:MAG: hypothetical protein SFY70_03205 [Bacteroidia bacterium]|nr:hypothetical protein [Bacteroidia bacterium]
MTHPTPPSPASAGLARAGRLLFITPFGVFGLMHLTGASQLATQYDVPLGVAGVVLSGIAMLLATLAVYLGKLDKLAALLLAVLMLVYIVSLHVPQAAAGGERGFMAIIGTFRDTAMAGAALMYAARLARDTRYTPTFL